MIRGGEMELEARLIELDDGEAVSSVWACPKDPLAAVVLAHGAGAGMEHGFMKYFHEGVARAGFLSVRFNFLYKEKGRRAPDPARRLEGTYRSVIGAVRSAGLNKLFIGGKSMGGRIASHLAARGEPVDGLFLLGYPLHPPHRTERLRVDHLAEIRQPALFVQGSRDALCKLELLKKTLSGLKAPVDLHVVDDGDHSFKPRKSSGFTEEEARRQALAVLTNWLTLRSR